MFHFLFTSPTISNSEGLAKVDRDFNYKSTRVTQWLNRNFIFWQVDDNQSSLRRISAINYVWQSIKGYFSATENPCSQRKIQDIFTKKDFIPPDYLDAGFLNPQILNSNDLDQEKIKMQTEIEVAISEGYSRSYEEVLRNVNKQYLHRNFSHADFVESTTESIDKRKRIEAIKTARNIGVFPSKEAISL